MMATARDGLVSSGSDTLLAAFDSTQLRRNGVPDTATAAGRLECRQLLVASLGSDLQALQESPLGVEWTEIFEAVVSAAVDDARLRALGWIPLDGLRPRSGRPLRRTAVWGVVDAGRLLGAVRILPEGARPDPVAAVLARCTDRGEVRLCDLFELRELAQRGHDFPSRSAALRMAAEIESGLGGRALAKWASGRVSTAPAPLTRARASRRVVVAISGVDGSGKSTLRTALADSLARCGIVTTTVWVRPGMGLGPLTAVAERTKRLLRQDAAPGIRAVAAQEGTQLRSRTGAVGWVWAMLVTASFLTGVWRQHRAARGVVLYDRHLVDALATLEFAYAGVDLRLPIWLVRSLLPRAAVRLYLDIPIEVSVARKPDDLIGADAIRRQLLGYERWLEILPATARLDATRPAAELLVESLRALTVTPG